jgi:A/G-specific adenine glycosylase
MGKLTGSRVASFRRKVWQFYKESKRDLPWRETYDPYSILVSEIMLQQTQVHRVLPKYQAFMKRFPTFQSLARARQSAVLSLWQGLGYNRRALALHRLTQAVTSTETGTLLEETTELIALPGIGPYTAAALQAFVWQKPSVVIETNIRSVYLHEFFPGKGKVGDHLILPLIEQTLDRRHVREWYYALMDYGSFIKQQFGNPNTRSRHYAKQSKFAGSNRQCRGQIIKLVLQAKRISLEALQNSVSFAPAKIEEVLDQLITEGFITRKNNTILIV